MSHPALSLTRRAQNCTVLKIWVHQSFTERENSSPLFSVPFLVTPTVSLAYLVAAAHQADNSKSEKLLKFELVGTTPESIDSMVQIFPKMHLSASKLLCHIFAHSVL